VKHTISTWKWLLFGFILSTSGAQQGQEYIDPKFGCRIILPAGWKQMTAPDSMPDALIAMFSNPAQTQVLSLAYESVPNSLPTPQRYDQAMNNFLGGMRETTSGVQGGYVKELARKQHQIDGLQVATLDVEQGTAGQTVLHRARLVIADNRLYMVSMTMLRPEFTRSETLINQTLDSFKPKNPASQQLPWGRILTVLGGICVCAGVGIAGTLFLVLQLARKR